MTSGGLLCFKTVLVQQSVLIGFCIWSWWWWRLHSRRTSFKSSETS
jgi:hypothetical protein